MRLPSRNKTFMLGTIGVLFGTTLMLDACKHEPLVQPEQGGGVVDTGSWVPPEDTVPQVVCDPDTVYFEQTILPLIVSNCTGVGSGSAGCHNAAHHAEGVRLYDYTHIMQLVSPGNPNSSHLLTQAIWQNGDDQMPPSGPMDPADVALIVTWIQQGAQNNSCVPTMCDTANVTFSGTIQPTLNTFCNGCHGGYSPDGNLDLTTYAGVVPVVNDGRLAGSIQHQSGFSSMPPVGSGLSDCRINQVLDWIAQGAPNN